ncbi:lipopolysaccharide biosynthesis protein [Altererythrobacter arenosus]|uniref:Lipopolysaccharide biosynthesis protein n=1 Tax=Altererythrobacter arenosus TaxID=3032592 RepID=A0ABY8FTK0_9SPHN|nr:lipopolysaccharide biosynthesis protein [Altererythrobacter sp. CAU 1644]WFL78329.1 lipopolysaccharide biosynthesis protein [Altererythrobacter sp. CAU 1644]
MSMKRGLVRGAFSLGGARAVTSAFNAVALLILARLLTPHDFGVAAIASAVLYFIVSLTQFSIYQALVQRSEVEQEHIDTAWSIALIRSLTIVAFFVLASWPLALLYDDPEMLSVFMVVGLTGGVMGLYNPHIVLAQKGMRFAPMALFQLCRCVGLVAVVILAIIFRSFWAIIIGNLIGAALASLISYVMIPYRPRFTLARFRDLWGFSGWLFLNQLCETINWRFDQLAISVLVPKAQMGIYAIAYSLAIIPTRETIQPLREILFPGLANLTNDRPRLTRAFVRAQSSMAAISTPLALGLALVAEPAVMVMLGPQWSEAAVFVQIFAVTSAIGAFVSCTASAAMALGATRVVFLQQFWTLMARVPLVLAGLHFYGLVGAALAGLLSEIILATISLRFVRSLLGLPIFQQLRMHWSTLLSLAVMSASVLAAELLVNPTFEANIVRFILLVLVGGVAYVGTNLALWAAGGRKEGPVHELIDIAAQMVPARFKAVGPA